MYKLALVISFLTPSNKVFYRKFGVLLSLLAKLVDVFKQLSLNFDSEYPCSFKRFMNLVTRSTSLDFYDSMYELKDESIFVAVNPSRTNGLDVDWRVEHQFFTFIFCISVC